jgi:malate dehydrogenase (oxaloacetate-decarboxylating)(NADP+)
MYIFPGLGLGTILAKAKHVTDSMVERASIALSDALTQEEKEAQLVYPRLGRIRDLSVEIALAVIRAAQKDVSVRLMLMSSRSCKLSALGRRWQHSFPQLA